MKQVTEMSFTSARPDKQTRRLALYPSMAMKRAPESPLKLNDCPFLLFHRGRSTRCMSCKLGYQWYK